MLSTNDYTNEDKSEVEKIKNKQDILTFDTEPKEGSNNPVTSGGIYTSVNNLKSSLEYAVTAYVKKKDYDTDIEYINNTISSKVDKTELEKYVLSTTYTNGINKLESSKVDKTTLDSYVKKTDYASDSTYGVVKVDATAIKDSENVITSGYVNVVENKVDKNEKNITTLFDTCVDSTSDYYNYNLFKTSECIYGYRLQNDSTEIVKSLVYVAITNKIPVEFGKFYCFSVEINGKRTTYNNRENVTENTSGYIGRIKVIFEDGTEKCDVRSEYIYDSKSSTIYINDKNAKYIQIQIGYICFDENNKHIPLTPNSLKERKVMIIEGKSAEEAKNNSLNFEYIDGEEKGHGDFTYTLKHDDTKAEKQKVDSIENELNNMTIDQKYNDDYLFNSKIIK